MAAKFGREVSRYLVRIIMVSIYLINFLNENTSKWKLRKYDTDQLKIELFLIIELNVIDSSGDTPVILSGPLFLFQC